MKNILTIAIILLSLASFAQQKQPQEDQVIESVEQWLRENLDDRVLQALEEIDRDRVRKFFTEVQRRFQGTDIYDLGALKETAERLLPVLLEFEETRSYGFWLQTHLDYLVASDELRRELKPAPPKEGKPVPLPRPSPQRQHSVWTKQLAKRPLPALAKNYVPQLKKIFAAERVPAELVWVAEVESSFNPNARSPAGAAGLFQLMPVTAQTLGLSLSPRDERLHPEKSGRAAAKYLRHLHTRFGDWRLALAAYNVGETRVANLLRQNKARSFDAIVHRLPAETQMFVPKVEATVRRREGRGLPERKFPAG